MTHRYVGNSAKEIAGTFYAPGDFLDLSKEDLQDSQVKEMLLNNQIMVLKGGDKSNG